MHWGMLSLFLAAALLCCSIGFKQFIWFMSVGYGFAVAGIALTGILFGLITGRLDVPLCLGLVVALFYGMRLGIFLYRRQARSKGYRKVLEEKSGQEPPLFVKIMMWICMGVLYTAQMSGLEFRLINKTPAGFLFWIGLILMIAGTILEALADHQKSVQKEKHPDRPAMKGLFQLVQFPNYFGEILFWFGVFVSGINAYQGWGQWLMAVLGFVSILFVMLDGVKRMEKGHRARYGRSKVYQHYVKTTPLLIPFVPWYHFEKPETN